MITIDHGWGLDFPVITSDATHEIAEQGIGYLMGVRPPRYPVPAPIHPVSWEMTDWLWINGYMETEMWNTICLWELTH